MRSIAGVLCLLWLSPAAVADEGLVISRQGRSEYVIVTAKAATPVEKAAARELQEHLKKVTGATLPIVEETAAAADKPRIVVGASRLARKLLPSVDPASLGDDAIVLKTVGRDLVLTGHPRRGALYAVYTFLEDTVGIRWWTPTENYIPKRPTLVIRPLDVNYAPKLIDRSSFYALAFDGRWSARQKLNGNAHAVPAEYGGRNRFIGFVHTFYPLLPPEKYFAKHPEWYSLLNGKRTHQYAQLCLTNDAMRAELTRNALARLRANPDARLISISQNDWHGNCQCSKCRAVEEREGSPAGLTLQFVNAVAEDIEKEFPDVLVETLAYQYTRKPPKHVRPRKNVVVRLCSIECSFVQPLATGKQNAAFRADIEGWQRIAPKLYVWDYVTNFSNYLLPHPNTHVLADNVRYFVDHNVIGLFEQGDYQSRIGDFVRLRAWLLAHLMWNPQANEDRLIADFMQGYYGPAAPHLTQYLQLMSQAGRDSGVYLRCFMPDTSSWLTLDRLNQATELFDRAEAAVADNPVLAERVRRERLPLDNVWLRRGSALQRQARLRNKPYRGPKDLPAAVERFIATARRHNPGNWREGRPFSQYEETLRLRVAPPAPAPPMCRDLPPSDWVDLQEPDFHLAAPGRWAFLVKDDQASNRRAVRMPGTHHEWALSCPLSADQLGPKPVHCYMAVRCEAGTEKGTAMTLGIYDRANRRGVAHRSVATKDLRDGKYHVIDLGIHKLSPEMYFWAAPANDTRGVKNVYVDRIVLVQEK